MPLLAAGAAIIASTAPVHAQSLSRLSGAIPEVVGRSPLVGHLETGQPIRFAVTLPLRNQGELNALIADQYNPASPRFHQWLSSAEFVNRFSPSESDYAAAIDYLKESGVTVEGTHPNRTLIDLSAPASTVENLFRVHLMRHLASSGREFYAPDADPVVDSALGNHISGVIGLDNAAEWHTHIRLPQPMDSSAETPFETGSGPNGALSPSDIKTAYGLSGTSLNGSGQTLAVFELDGYAASDITGYETHFGLPSVPLQNVLIDGATGSAGSGAPEVTLDVELQAALAPAASKIMVYEAPNSGTGVIDEYNRIAADNLAKEISTSWGAPEGSVGASALNAENTAFQQMAAQGQSIFAAAGDSGAYDNGSTLGVDDPASQPYMTGVGGTSLHTNGGGGVWSSETTWNGGSPSAGAGGGGISTEWSIPSYQSGVVTSASKGSTTMRNVPDVSLDADPNTGYAIYYQGTWTIYGGTSCAAPLWSAFAALVNQQRLAGGQSLLGFANPSIYSIGKGSRYSADFHDIADSSTNLYYPAVTGYDNATGWGSFIGSGLLTDLAGSGSTASPSFTLTASPSTLSLTQGTQGTSTITVNGSNGFASAVSLAVSGLPAGVTTSLSSSSTTSTSTLTLTASSTAAVGTATVTITGTSGSLTQKATITLTIGSASTSPQQILLNPGFESGNTSWTATSGVINNSGTEPPHTGTWDARLCGYGTTHTDTLMQQVTIPSGKSSAILTFWLHVDTAETTTTAANDTLKLQICNSSGVQLATIATYSNLNAAAGYSEKIAHLTAYIGQTIQIRLVGSENGSLATSFVLDDFALNVQ